MKATEFDWMIRWLGELVGYAERDAAIVSLFARAIASAGRIVTCIFMVQRLLARSEMAGPGLETITLGYLASS